MLKWLWPISTGQTFFDYWSIAHFAFWWVVGSSLAQLPWGRPKTLAVCFALAYVWEIFERFAEPRWPTIWLSPEGSVNAYVSDPLMCVLALVLAWYGFDHWRPQ